MTQFPSGNAPDLHDAEWVFLRCLCSSSLPVDLRQEFCAKLQAAQFSDLAHRTVFEEICTMSKPHNVRSVEDLRGHLASRVTARGFPDLDFADLLSQVSEEPLTALRLAYGRLAGTK